MTRAQVFEELIEVVLGQKCTLAPVEGGDGDGGVDVQGESQSEPEKTAEKIFTRNS